MKGRRGSGVKRGMSLVESCLLKAAANQIGGEAGVYVETGRVMTPRTHWLRRETVWRAAAPRGVEGRHLVEVQVQLQQGAEVAAEGREDPKRLWTATDSRGPAAPPRSRPRAL